jgi:tetratricopeptide (TPR) repeat protein
MQRWPAAARIGTLAVVAGGLIWVNLEFSGFWKDNLTLYRHGADVAPDNPRAIIQLAEELVLEQQPAEAVPLFQKALLEHNWYDSYESIGYCYLMMREFAQAEGYLYRAISLESTNHVARSYLAEVEWRLGHLQEAETQARQALQLRKAITPKNSNYHALLGGILADEGDFTGARAEYQAEFHEYPSGGAQKALADLEDRVKLPPHGPPQGAPHGAGGSGAQ